MQIYQLKIKPFYHKLAISVLALKGFVKMHCFYISTSYFPNFYLLLPLLPPYTRKWRFGVNVLACDPCQLKMPFTCCEEACWWHVRMPDVWSSWASSTLLAPTVMGPLSHLVKSLSFHSLPVTRESLLLFISTIVFFRNTLSHTFSTHVVLLFFFDIRPKIPISTVSWSSLIAVISAVRGGSWESPDRV